MSIARIRRNWEHFGRVNPMWAVLTSRRDWSSDEFFETGKREIDDLMADLAQLGTSVRLTRALDFGCGIGRLTLALAAHFDHVTGVDISDAMIEEAEKHNHLAGRVTYFVNVAPDLAMFEDECFTFIYSNIVLQHNPPDVTKRYLLEFLRVLAPDGILVFQLPSHLVDQSLTSRTLERALPASTWFALQETKYIVKNGLRRTPRMEMYGIEKSEVISFLESNGARIMDARCDNRETANIGAWEDYVYFVGKCVGARRISTEPA